jgi:hypothetical protein
MGYETRIWAFEEHPFGYGQINSIFKLTDYFLKREVKRWITLLKVLVWSDVIHCTFGSTLAGNSGYVEHEKAVRSLLRNVLIAYEKIFLTIELLLYKISKKVLIIDYQGDDIRQKNYQLENYEHSIAHSVPKGYYLERNDLRKRERLSKFIKYGFQINALNPDLLHYLPPTAKFVPYSHVDINKAKNIKISPQNKMRRPLIFVHAPSNRTVKGTTKIQQAVHELNAEGFQIELRLVENMKNSDALKIYQEAYMAIDQINAGWYGGFAVECMSLGIPVISYIRESDLSSIPNLMKIQIPIINACPCTIKEVLKRCAQLTDLEYLELSERHRNYVQEWHDPDRIALEVVRTYS